MLPCAGGVWRQERLIVFKLWGQFKCVWQLARSALWAHRNVLCAYAHAKLPGMQQFFFQYDTSPRCQTLKIHGVCVAGAGVGNLYFKEHFFWTE